MLFDHHYAVLHDRIDIKAVSPISEKEYFVRGNTALFDAIGSTISKISSVQMSTAEVYRAEKVLFVITTDGMENASREYGYDKIKTMIEHQKTKFGWEFLFLGANIDTVAVAQQFSVDKSRAQSFHNDSEGIALNYKVLS